MNAKHSVQIDYTAEEVINELLAGFERDDVWVPDSLPSNLKAAIEAGWLITLTPMGDGTYRLKIEKV